MRKRERELSALAARFGRIVRHTRNGHYALVDPKGVKPVAFTSGSPSCHRVMKNLEKELQRKDGVVQ